MIAEETIQSLRDCELDMLKVFSDVCNKLNLQYFTIGGTLLGAVRHNGFIPWDDDIDVGMFRKDYEKFISEGQALLPRCYFIQTHKSDPQYKGNYAKLRDSRTTFIETVTKNMKINHGVFIDIFPIDYYPDNRFNAKILEFEKKVLTYRIRSDSSFERTTKYSIKAKAMILFSHLCYPNVKKAVETKERLISRNPKSSLVANYCGAWDKKEIVPTEWLSEICYFPFEGMLVPCPKCYDKYLRHIYGDYMQLPPVEKRVTHHYTEVIDLEKPYTEYIKAR